MKNDDINDCINIGINITLVSVLDYCSWTVVTVDGIFCWMVVCCYT